MKRCDGSPTLKNMSRLFCATLVDTATLQQNETICPLTPGQGSKSAKFFSERSGAVERFSQK